MDSTTLGSTTTTITVHANAGGGWSWERDENNRRIGGGWFSVTGTDEQVAAYILRTGDRLCFDLGTDEDYERAMVESPLVCRALRIGPFEEQCEHGLSAWLCADPVSHYPRNM